MIKATKAVEPSGRRAEVEAPQSQLSTFNSFVHEMRGSCQVPGVTHRRLRFPSSAIRRARPRVSVTERAFARRTLRVLDTDDKNRARSASVAETRRIVRRHKLLADVIHHRFVI